MLKTTLSRFEELAKQGRIVPVYGEFPADMETPVSVLRRFREDENVFLFESVEGGERFGRYSFLGVNPRGIFTVEDGRAFYAPLGERREKEPAQRRELTHDGCPLHALRELLGGTFAADPDLPPLPGGAVGFLGFEAVRMFEVLPEPKAAVATPDCAFLLVDEIIAFDNLRHTLKLIVCSHTAEYADLKSAYQDAVARIGRLEERLRSADEAKIVESIPSRTVQQPLEPEISPERFRAMVETARGYIRDGEAIQIVLSQRFSAPCASSAFQLYRALRFVNPSPYLFFLKLAGVTLIGSSPETMVKLENGRSSLRPIAGTRPRGRDARSDRTMADELLRDPKERAEHLMLVDLGRNDLGRTALPGSVQVKNFMVVERYSHVMHLVSDVEAELREDCDAFDLVAATFPAGTLSGAPKIRAMELIREIEDGSRGVYGGAVGYLSYDGNMDLAITIRTLELRDGMIHVQAGAGIVADSDPYMEYQETKNKAGALFRALELAANDLNF